MSKILLIKKDDDSCSQILPEIFCRLGFETICVESVGDAGKYIVDGDMYAVFIDIDVVSDSCTLDALIKIAKPYSMVVLLGSDRHLDMISHAFDAGADDYLREPYNEKIFEAKMRGIFARYDYVQNVNNRNVENLLDNTPPMMAIIDAKGQLLYANACMRNKYRLSAEEVRGKMICEVISCENYYKEGRACERNCEACKFFKNKREVFATGNKVTCKINEYPKLCDGRVYSIPLRYSMTMIQYCNRKSLIVSIEEVSSRRDAVNELTSIICSLRESNDNVQPRENWSRDLEERLQKINDTLISEKNKHKLLFDNMSSGFVLIEKVDENLYIREGNAKISEILEKDVSNFYGIRLQEDSISYTPDFYKALSYVIATGQPMRFSFKSPNTKFVYRVNMYVPEPNFVAVFIDDITTETMNYRENKEHARQLQRLNVLLDDRNSELLKAIDTKNKFISIIAHDLRNPLNAINGLSELLTKRLSPETDQRAYDMAKVLHQSAKGAYDLLDNLLIWARTQQNTIPFNPETLNVHSVTDETINEIWAQAERKRIMLINSTESTDTVWADKLMLQTIVRNIISNAIKFTNEGGLVVVGSNQTADSTEITIDDNGVGMSQETIDKILSSTELNSTKGTSGEPGTGMGLIISKEFIQRHKGTFNIESTIGKGSSFIITLPRYKKNVEENK